MALTVRDADDARLVHPHGTGAVRSNLRHARGRRAGARRCGRRPERWRTSSRSSDQTERSSPTPPIPQPPVAIAMCSWSRPPKSGSSSTREASARCSSSATRDGRFPFRWRRTRADGGSTPLREKRKCSTDESAATSWRSSESAARYVAAQRLYAERGHDGQPAGLYARTFRSDPGRENGLFWPAGRGQTRSPLGDLVAHAAAEGRPLGNDGPQPSPFHGYYFKILTAQGPAAAGGAKDYVVDGRMSGGFALVAWPAQYDVTGVMTFVVNQDGIVREKDLGPETDGAARAMTLYNPDGSWGSGQ